MSFAFLLALWLCVPIAIIVVGALPIDDAERDTVVPVILLVSVWPLTGVVALLWAGWLFLARRWLRAGAALALPVFIATSLAASGWGPSAPIIEPVFRLNRQLHFATLKPTYEAAVLAMRGPGHHLKLFVWEMNPIGGSGVVYDDSDDIALPKSRRPKNWSAREKQYPAALDELCYIDPLGSHYYLITFGCTLDGK